MHIIRTHTKTNKLTAVADKVGAQDAHLYHVAALKITLAKSNELHCVVLKDTMLHHDMTNQIALTSVAPVNPHVTGGAANLTVSDWP